MSSLVVFGATSAIAQAFLNRVAQRYDVITLVARNREHVEQIGSHIQVVAGVDVTCLVWDLANENSHAELMNRIGSSIDTALICYGELSDQSKCIADAEYGLDQLRINGTSTILLSAKVAAVMRVRRTGILAVVGSVAGDRGRRSNYYYGAAKGALDKFLAGLRSDMFPAGVRVVTVKPGFVDSPMTKDFKKGLLWAKPEKVAADIDKAICGSAEVIYTPWFWRYIMLVIKCIPEKFFKRLSI